jgi:glycosyltransferase involved in cell wall biosynthesis
MDHSQAFTSKSSNVIRLPHTGAPKAPERDWLRHIGLLNDYVRIPYANGSSFASQFLYRELGARGHRVTVVGPHDPEAQAHEMPERHVLLPSIPFRNHPGVHIPMPSRKALAAVAAQRFDVTLGQTCSELLDLGVWLRYTQHVPFLCVNTVHMPSVYNVLLPDALLKNKLVDRAFSQGLMPFVEGLTANVYNESDGLIVLCRGLEQYWRDRGVTVPIHVIPRAIDLNVFDRDASCDPFDPRAPRGGRLLVVCRHTREKGVSRLLELFAQHVAPKHKHATLTLVGDGPDHDTFRKQAEQLGIADRTFFPGEYPVTQMVDFYRNADVFVYPSLSETYGQVVSEAMWCGLPVVAFEDGMGVSHQISSGDDGILIAPGCGQSAPEQAAANRDFAEAVNALLSQPAMRLVFAQRAADACMKRAHPKQAIARYYEAFDSAKRQSAATAMARIAKPAAGMRIVAKWAAVHSAAVVAGMIRPPAVLNRHGRKQPGWEIDQVTAEPQLNASKTPDRESGWPGKASSLFG